MPSNRRRGHPSPYDSRTYREARKRIRGQSCEMCGAPPPSTVDHRIPVAMGGTNDPENLRPLCRSCNSKLGGALGNRIRARRRRW